MDCDLKNLTGTNYQCLRKGIAQGLNIPSSDYVFEEPAEKIYCGNKTNPPPGYKRHGNRAECFKKGVTVGQNKRKEMINNNAPLVDTGRKGYVIYYFNP